MRNPKQLPGVVVAERVEHVQFPVGAAIIRAEVVDHDIKHDITTRNIHVTDMTATTAEAIKETARYQYAVPAQEETKRAVQVSLRRYMSLATCLAAAGLLIAWPEQAKPIVALFGIAMGINNLPDIIRAIRKSDD